MELIRENCKYHEDDLELAKRASVMYDKFKSLVDSIDVE